MCSLFETAVSLFIRPQRDVYDERKRLGRTKTRVCGVTYERVDVSLANSRGEVLRASLWRLDESRWPRRPTIVYLHPNCGNRSDACEVFEVAAAFRCSVCSLDFAGAGNSGGAYISLGYHERDDVCALLDWLYSASVGFQSKIVLWGRSMGAATALLYVGSLERGSAERRRVAGLVLDSAFSSLRQVAEEVSAMITSMLPGPRCLYAAFSALALALIRRSIVRQARFDIDRVAPIDVVGSLDDVPALFAHARSDAFIDAAHSQRLYDAYGSQDASIQLVVGDHNSLRVADFYDAVTLFFAQHLLGGQAQASQSAARKWTAVADYVPKLYGGLASTPVRSCFLCRSLPARSHASASDNVVVVIHASEGVSVVEPFTERRIMRVPLAAIADYGSRGARFMLRYRVVPNGLKRPRKRNSNDERQRKLPLHIVQFATPEADDMLGCMERIAEAHVTCTLNIGSLDDYLDELIARAADKYDPHAIASRVKRDFVAAMKVRSNDHGDDDNDDDDDSIIVDDDEASLLFCQSIDPR
jgi:pimeloyl-ACP methyl ester carboxylesterase